MNKQGDLRTNTHSEGPNAVTWGVFPGKEIVQVGIAPRHFEGVQLIFSSAHYRRSGLLHRMEVGVVIRLCCMNGTDIRQRDEAFELGLQWANLYPESSSSRQLIEDTMSTSYLVNIVANDFKDGQSIFQPFLLEQQSAPAAHLTNGAKESKCSLINGSTVNGHTDEGSAVNGSTVNGTTVNGNAVNGSMANGARHTIEANGNGH